jgi:hypothetical protein
MTCREATGIAGVVAVPLQLCWHSEAVPAMAFMTCREETVIDSVLLQLCWHWELVPAFTFMTCREATGIAGVDSILLQRCWHPEEPLTMTGWIIRRAPIAARPRRVVRKGIGGVLYI